MISKFPVSDGLLPHAQRLSGDVFVFLEHVSKIVVDMHTSS